MRKLAALAAIVLICVAPLRAEESPQALRERLARAELLAGLTAVEGPGLSITLRHSARAVPKGADRGSFRVHDQDVNAVLNALRAAGAEALALGAREQGNEALERVLANTAAVDGKSGLEVNASVFKAPYRVLAIGDAKALRAELFRKGGVVQRAGLDVLGMIQLEDSARLTIPPAKAPGSFRFARVPGAEAPVRPAGLRPAVREEPGLAPAPPVVRSAPRTSPTEPPATAVAMRTGTFFGGKGLAKYHLSGCRFGERIEASQRVRFGSTTDARQGGRVPCAVCRPDQLASR